jgi:hypothetical protein
MGPGDEGRADYRLFLFDGKGPRTYALKFRCNDDADALERAERLRGGRIAELWRQETVLKAFRDH